MNNERTEYNAAVSTGEYVIAAFLLIASAFYFYSVIRFCIRHRRAVIRVVPSPWLTTILLAVALLLLLL